MKDTARAARERSIETAAYTVLGERGFAGASMLTIAKAAKASNETLYRWYGDKTALFTALVERNADLVSETLDAALAKGHCATDCLHQIAPVLLGMLLSERAILLNRAAASDPTGTLGAALAAGGRDRVRPRLIALMQRAKDEGAFSAQTPEQACDWFLTCLIGDLQIRRVTGALPEPDADQIAARVALALAMFAKLTEGPGRG
ncbi:MAG: TetR/AcrR family transcriptional regulator [Sedimentitalea sp.]